jgi:hypothetical protein
MTRSEIVDFDEHDLRVAEASTPLALKVPNSRYSIRASLRHVVARVVCEFRETARLDWRVGGSDF